jgi:hypothetical protein
VFEVRDEVFMLLTDVTGEPIVTERLRHWAQQRSDREAANDTTTADDSTAADDA